MFKKSKGVLLLAVMLILTSVIIYALHFQLFHDWHHIAIFFVEDVAFIPIEVLIVTLIIHRALHSHEKRQMMGKLNMVIGTFFSHVGSDLLRILRTFDMQDDKICNRLNFNHVENPRDIDGLKRNLSDWDTSMDTAQGDLGELKTFLAGKIDFLMSMLENQNLLEHQSFTDMLWAVFHVADELTHRDDLEDMPADDAEHIAGDLFRAYKAAVFEWVDYMKHLKTDYPYLYSLAVRLNPFDPNACATITK